MPIDRTGVSSNWALGPTKYTIDDSNDIWSRNNETSLVLRNGSERKKREEEKQKDRDREKEIQINKSMMMEKSLFSILVKDE